MNHFPAFKKTMRWAAVILVLLAMAVGVGRRYQAGYGFTRMLNMGEEFYAKALPEVREIPIVVRSAAGYDGSQYVQLAFDPLLRDKAGLKRALDIPSYRAKRIFLPWLSLGLGAGHSRWMVQIYALLNVVFWVGLLILFLRICPEADWYSLAVIFGVVLSTGALESVRRALTDLPATTLALAAVYCSQSARSGAGTGLMVLAGLTRETVLLTLFGMVRRDNEKKWGNTRNLAVVIGVMALCGIWFGYVTLRFPSAGSVTGNFGWPLVSMGDRIGKIIILGNWQNPLQLFCLLTMVSLTIQALYLLLHPRWENAFWRMGILFVPLYFCLGKPVWEEYYAVTRVVLPLTIAFHLQLREQRDWRFWGWFVPGNLYLWQGINKFFLTSN